jgi:hypothetical protein
MEVGEEEGERTDGRMGWTRRRKGQREMVEVEVAERRAVARLVSPYRMGAKIHRRI